MRFRNTEILVLVVQEDWLMFTEKKIKIHQPSDSEHPPASSFSVNAQWLCDSGQHYSDAQRHYLLCAQCPALKYLTLETEKVFVVKLLFPGTMQL